MKKRRKWNIATTVGEDDARIQEIASHLNISRLTAKLLYNRGFTDKEKAWQFVKKEAVMFHDPFKLLDMEKAVERIIKAVENNEKIVIYGDYDVDGVTSVSILYIYLKKRGASVSYYIPSRTGEGYGINPSAIKSLVEEGLNLLITVDTGITAVEETEYANSQGIDVIITDHHECRNEMPNAAAVINPRREGCPYPFKELAGVGVVFKLLCALECTYAAKGMGEKDYIREICTKYGDLVAIGTVADVMPLIDENRLIVSIGLARMESSKRIGLEALFEMSSGPKDKQYPKKKKKITSTIISYVIAPRINAAGRISNATRAVELFLTDSMPEALEIADELCQTNRERQTEENNIIEQAYKKIHEEHDFDNDPIIVLAQEEWHNGIIGIVSSRITEHYNLPSILISYDGDIGKGSGRSIKGLNIVDALVHCNDLLLKYGGHELAAGLSIERSKVPEFKERINAYAREHLTADSLVTCVDIDSELQTNDLNLAFAEELYLLEPYGISNPVPVFALKNAEIVDSMLIGNGRHTKYTVKKDGQTLTALFFGKSLSELDFYSGDDVDIIFNIDINEYQNTKTVQMIVRDMDYSDSLKKKIENERALYNDIKNGRKIKPEEDYFPARDDFVRIYLHIQQEVRQGNNTISIHSIMHKIKTMPYIKIRFVIDILHETNVLGVERAEFEEDKYIFKLYSFKNKINIEKSNIYKLLKSKVEH